MINQKIASTTTTVIRSGVLFGYDELPQVIAAEQLWKEGVEVSAGKTVRFRFTSAKNKRYERRVRAEELIEEKTHSDVGKYLLLLYSAASNILSPFGYSAQAIYDSVGGYQHTKLTSFFPAISKRVSIDQSPHVHILVRQNEESALGRES